MRSIHDKDSSSQAQEPASARASRREAVESLAQRKDELETVLAVGRVGFCRLSREA